MRPRRSSPLQRSEQVFTLSQSFAHFLRQVKGRAQAAQIFRGRSAFRRILGMARPPCYCSLGQHDRQFDLAVQDPDRDVGDHEREIVLHLASARLIARDRYEGPSISTKLMPETRSNSIVLITWQREAGSQSTESGLIACSLDLNATGQHKHRIEYRAHVAVLMYLREGP